MPTVDLFGARWRKSGGTGGGNDNCMEVAFGDELAAVRDSKQAGGPVLAFPARSWAALLAATR
ncbi:MAG TPA: DUF397 domain-containing protein [Pseudonocardiaceae bacterium]